MNLHEVAELWRERAATSTDRGVWATSHAFNAAERNESDAALLAALTEQPTPQTDTPPWSQVSAPGTCDGPLRF